LRIMEQFGVDVLMEVPALELFVQAASTVARKARACQVSKLWIDNSGAHWTSKLIVKSSVRTADGSARGDKKLLTGPQPAVHSRALMA